MKYKKTIIDDLTGVAGSLAGLVNDARNQIINKKTATKNTFKSMRDAQTILDRLEALESRIQKIEQQMKTSKS